MSDPPPLKLIASRRQSGGIGGLAIFFANRLVGTLSLRGAVYDEVARDRGATGQAVGVLAVVLIGASISPIMQRNTLLIVLAAFSPLLWVAGFAFTYAVARSLYGTLVNTGTSSHPTAPPTPRFRGENVTSGSAGNHPDSVLAERTSATFGNFARAVAYASAPNLLSILDNVSMVRRIPSVVAMLWITATSTVAVRQVFSMSTWRALVAIVVIPTVLILTIGLIIAVAVLFLYASAIIG